MQKFELLNDEEILELIVQGSRDAFSEIVRRHATRFYRIAYRFLNVREEAEDVVQDVFLKLWQDPGLWNGNKNAKFTTWFYRIIVNRCLDIKKKNKNTVHQDLDFVVDENPNQEEEIDISNREIAVKTALRALPANYQTVLNLSFYEGVSNKEAAEIMNISLKAFQSLLMRAKTTLRKMVMSDQVKKERIYAKK